MNLKSQPLLIIEEALKLKWSVQRSNFYNFFLILWISHWVFAQIKEKRF